MQFLIVLIFLFASTFSYAQTTKRFEAEHASLTNEIAILNSNGASNHAVAEIKNSGSITWEISVDNDNNYDLTIAYASPYGYKEQTLLVNNAPQTLGFNQGQGVLQVATPLVKGSNTIVLRSAWGWVNLDYLDVSGLNNEAPPPETTEENIQIVNAATSIKSSGVYTLSLSYNTNNNRKVAVSMKNPGDGWAWYGETHQSLDSHINTVDISVALQNSPPEGSGYIWEVKLIDDSTSEVIDYKSLDIEVKNTPDQNADTQSLLDPTTDDLINTNGPIDALASNATRALFHNLKSLGQDKFLFGYTDANIMGFKQGGQPWFFNASTTDVHDVVGDNPAIYAFDIVNIQSPNPNQAETLEKIVPAMREAYARGGVITTSWHAFNPITGENYHQGNPVADLLPGRVHHTKLTTALDKIADKFGNLTDHQGRSIPIIFRPHHEMDGSHFWWCSDRLTPLEFKVLWQTTVKYLRDTRGVHNFLYAYSPTDFFDKDEASYLEFYPGDKYVDVLGLDTYGFDEAWYKARVIHYAELLANLGQKRNKVNGFTETGVKGSLSNINNPNWISEFILEPVKSSSLARGLGFVVFWRNEAYNPPVHYVPYAGSANAGDLSRFYNDPFTVFERDLPDLYQ